MAATTKKRARELVQENASPFNNYWAETFNDVELAVATEEGVWYAPLQGRRTADDYKRVR